MASQVLMLQAENGGGENIVLPDIIQRIVNLSDIRVLGRLGWSVPYPYSHGDALRLFGVSPSDKYTFLRNAKSEELVVNGINVLGAEVFIETEFGGKPVGDLVNNFVNLERRRLGVETVNGILCYYVAVRERPLKQVIIFSASDDRFTS
jgi:hypothetical protein